MPKVTSGRLQAHREGKRSVKTKVSGKTPAEGAKENREKRLLLIYGVPPLVSLPATNSPTPDKPENEATSPPTSEVTIPVLTPSNETLQYTKFNADRVSHREFGRKFFQNSFGHTCDVCDRLWFKNDLTKLPPHFSVLLSHEIPESEIEDTVVCKSCTQFLIRNQVPIFAKFHGFKYPEIPAHLPSLDPMSERLISPRLPFKTIHRLRSKNGQYENSTQIINIPVSENNMIHHLPRYINDDGSLYVDIEQRQIYKSDHFINSVNKRDIMTWLRYLISSPLYVANDITLDQSFFNDPKLATNTSEVTGNVLLTDSLTEKQHTLLWNVDNYIKKDAKDGETHNRMFAGQAEELSFPSIYLGRARVFKDIARVTPSMIATSELMRSDRRGVTPDHLLYMAMKIMRLKVHESLHIVEAAEKDSKSTRQQIVSGEFFNHYLQSSLTFLRCIPNSAWYWKERKRDLFAMMRQLGKPTLSLTVSANEICWTPLLQLLHRLKNNGVEVPKEVITQLNFAERINLVNADPVTCVIYFNRMVDVLITLLQSQTGNPFGKYRVLHHFQRIEFQYPRSPSIHILLWLDNAPKNALGADGDDAVALIDELISVSVKESSGNIQLQTHQHTSTCYKRGVEDGPQLCQFEAPFMPCRVTTILTPMKKTDPEFTKNAEHYKKIRMVLEEHEYLDIDEFYEDNGITSDEHYIEVLRAGITRPRIFVKREPSEKWHEAFNPFILNILQAHMNMQLILDAQSCADYVIDCVTKTDRGINELQRKVIAIMDEHPEMNLSEIAKKLSVDVLNTVEITSQEAAWYLLREPTSKSSSVIAPIQTVWPYARQKLRKNYYELPETEDEEELIDCCKEDWFKMYEARPAALESVTLAQFVSHYTRNFNNTTFVQRKVPRIIRYRNYDMVKNPTEFKREMVTLHVPFRNEELDVLADMKFLQQYDNHEHAIELHRMDFESGMNIQKIIAMCNRLCRNEDIVDDEAEVRDFGQKQAEPDPFQAIYDKESLVANSKIDDMMSSDTSWASIRIKIENPDELPFQIYSSSPAKSRKTFITRLLMEIYNSNVKPDGSCNVYVHVGSTTTDRATDDGPPTYTSWKISSSKMFSMSEDSMQQYRELFTHVQALIIDETHRIDGDVLPQIDANLKRITGNSEALFGGIDIILTGDLLKFPVDPKYRLTFLDLDKVVMQSNRVFSLVLTKIGRNMQLDESERQLLESRFFSREEADQLCPHGIRLFSTMESVNEYNEAVLESSTNKVVSVAKDVYIGCDTPDGEVAFVETLRNMSVIHTAGLPYTVSFILKKTYMLTTAVDGLPELVPGSLGRLVYIETNPTGEVSRVWLEFYNSPQCDVTKNRKLGMFMRAHHISENAAPVTRQTSSIVLKDGETVLAIREHFPLVEACAVTANKAQGEKLPEIVYEYSEAQPQQQVYTALSQATNITKLYIVTANNNPTFYHARKSIMKDEPDISIVQESSGIDKEIVDFIASRPGLSILSFDLDNRADVNDAGKKSEILLLSETCSDNDEVQVVPKFSCMARFKRYGVKNSPAVYHNSKTRTSIVTAHMNVQLRQSSCLIASTRDVGEICAARCALDSRQNILVVVIYLADNQQIGQLISFINEALLEYTVEGGALLGTDSHKLPIILSGDFNIKFDAPETQPLIKFLDVAFDLKLTIDSSVSGGQNDTKIEAVFTRYLDQLQSTSYVSYFSYDKPVGGETNCENMETL